MEQFTEWLRGPKLIHPPAALLTFDGGYDDQIENALPVLEQFQFPATFFPVSADLGEEPGHLGMQRRNELPAALLTFDGYYDDQIENALPVLEQFQFPATFFPVSDGLGEESGHLAVLRRNELRAIEKSGHSIGCHSHSHPDLTGLSGADLHREVHGSKQILEEIMGRPVNAFCYPYGAYDARVRKVVQEAGFDVAFTVDLGGVRRGDDLYLLKRVPVLGEPSVGEFTAYLSGTLGVSGSILLYWKLRERLLDGGWLTSQKAHPV